jgi:hypothetical protein
MGASTKPFLALQEDLSWFMSCPELRVLHVATGGDERSIVLHQVALAEGHPRNRSPFFVLEDAHTQGDDGWTTRADRMRVIHAARREAMAREGYKLPFLEPLERADKPLVTMALQIDQCLEAQRAVAELQGLVLVLAPARLEKPKAFVEAIGQLADSRALASVRFIVVEIGETAREPTAYRFKEAAMATTCFVDGEAQQRELGELLDAAAQAPSGASPEVQAGGAGPLDVCAPPRFGHPARDAELPPEFAAALKAELGPAAALVGPAGLLLKQRVFGAANAIQKGRFPDALRLQGEARDQCYSAGLTRLALLLETTRASYLFAASQKKPAKAAFEQAAERAEGTGLFDLAAQAFLGAASLCAVERDWYAAALLANRAGRAGEQSGEMALAIEAYRCAGQFALRVGAGSEKVAIDRWRRAIEIAKESPPEVSRHSSAPVVARALAKILIGKGAEAAAATLLKDADDWERGEGEQRSKKKRGKKRRRPTLTGTEVMATGPGVVRKLTDTEIAELAKPEPRSVTPTGTEILGDPPRGRDDVRG